MTLPKVTMPQGGLYFISVPEEHGSHVRLNGLPLSAWDRPPACPPFHAPFWTDKRDVLEAVVGDCYK